MSLLVIDFTYLEGSDAELVFKELAAADYHCNKISSYVFKRPYSWEDVPIFNTRKNAVDYGDNWNDGDVLYSLLETVLHREASSAVGIYCFGSQKNTFY
jgi:adenylate kinase family enzyme